MILKFKKFKRIYLNMWYVGVVLLILAHFFVKNLYVFAFTALGSFALQYFTFFHIESEAEKRAESIRKDLETEIMLRERRIEAKDAEIRHLREVIERLKKENLQLAKLAPGGEMSRIVEKALSSSFAGAGGGDGED